MTGMIPLPLALSRRSLKDVAEYYKTMEMTLLIVIMIVRMAMFIEW